MGNVKHRGNGQGTVIRRGKTFTAIVTVGRYTENGKTKYIRKSKGGFRTRSAALAFLPVLAGKTDSAPNTFQAMWDAYLAGPYKKLGGSKQVAYDIAAKRWKTIMSQPVDDITIKELRSTLDKETKTYYPAKDMQSTLSHMFKIAMAQKLTAVNLSRFLVLPENNEKEGEPFVETELHKMWAAWSPGDMVLGSILLMIYTGMMPGEMLRLYVCNVDQEAMEITDIGLKTAVRREAPIPYPHFLAPIIDDLILHAGKKGKMVPVQKDNYYTRYYAKLAELGIRKLPPYSCRHTTGTALAKGNIAPATIQKAMRHAKLETQKRYTHMDTSDVRAALDITKPDQVAKQG